ncbi:MAG: hypothetical protein ACTJHT_14145 [Sphingobacterium sp.]
MIDKGELIEKGTGGVTKLTNAAHQKTLAFCLVVSLIVIFWQRYDNNKLTNRILNTTEDLQEKRIEELKSMVHGEVSQQVRPIAEKVDTIKQNADSTFKNINEKLP